LNTSNHRRGRKSLFNTITLAGATALSLGSALAAAPAAATEAMPWAALPIAPVRLPGALQGAQALAALGEQLPAVAARYGLSPQRLAAILQQDPAAWLDRDGRLFYVEAPAPAPAAASAPQQAPFPNAQTFLLHSKPGAPRVIYLDFNGHTVSGTAWKSGTINAVAYSEDADRTSFSDTELQNIQLAWQAVANDYAPFDVDVTTEEPAAGAITRSDATDQNYGTRAVITENNFGACTGCGGVAYVEVFDETSQHAYYQPAWIFNKGSGKVIAETIAHEVGHNLGLSHDGTATASYYEGHGSGATGWAPIMGAGFYQEVSQWSKGEYPGANNSEDDLTIIDANGANYLVDDFPLDFAGGYDALPLLAATSSGNGDMVADQSGMVGRNADSDDFAFDCDAGPIALDVIPQAAPGPNLDVVASLYDVDGNLIASANDTEGLGASLRSEVAAGYYFLRIAGTGDGDPSPGYSRYGSLGAYRITGSYPESGALDTRPNPYSYVAQTNVPRNALRTSNSVTISGIEAPAPISVSNGSYSINGATFVATAGSIRNGDRIRVQHRSSTASNTSVTTTMTIGGVKGTFKTTTGDNTPDAFSFAARTGVARSSLQTSDPVTVSGITLPTAVSANGGSYSINGGAYVTAAGKVVNGNVVRVQHSAAAAGNAAVNTTLNIGGVTARFTSTTLADPSCTGCTAYSGSLAAGASLYLPGSAGFAYSGGTLQGWLSGPAGANFDLYLEKYSSGMFGVGAGWSTVASSTGTTSGESVSYSAASATYRWRIQAVSGSGAYTLYGKPK